jgi:hypothetical protein
MADYNWAEKFAQGLSKLEDNGRLLYSLEIATDVAVSQVEMIRTDREVKIGNVADIIGYSQWSAYCIMNDNWHFQKVCIRCIF